MTGGDEIISCTADLYREFNLAAERIGLYELSDQFCCQILAVLYVEGNETMVVNSRISTDILIAQRRLNLFAAEIPNQKLIPNLKEYIDDLEKNKIPPKWLEDLEKHYGVKLRLSMEHMK